MFYSIFNELKRLAVRKIIPRDVSTPSASPKGHASLSLVSTEAYIYIYAYIIARCSVHNIETKLSSYIFSDTHRAATRDQFRDIDVKRDYLSTCPSLSPYINIYIYTQIYISVRNDKVPCIVFPRLERQLSETKS